MNDIDWRITFTLGDEVWYDNFTGSYEDAKEYATLTGYEPGTQFSIDVVPIQGDLTRDVLADLEAVVTSEERSRDA